jgi:MFS family permease
MILASFGVFYTALPAYLKGIGLSDGIVSLFFLMNSLVSTGTFLLLNGLSTRMVDKRLIRLGIAAKLVGDFGFLVLSMTGVYVPNAWMAAVVLVSVGASWAVIWPPLSALLSKLADDRKLGDAQGKLSASGGLGGISGPLLAGYLFALAGYPCAFLGSGLIVIAGFLLFLKLR